ncbi:MAG: hypothetical protein Tsb0015_05600 [Simkaniaceae bacterium]
MKFFTFLPLFPLIIGQMDSSSMFSKQQLQEAKMLDKEAAASAKASAKENSLLIIEPKNRAKDFMEAYQTLKKEKAAGAIQFHLSSGQVLSHITDIKLLEGGTLLIFQMSTPKGQKFEVVKIEDIQSISFS